MGIETGAAAGAAAGSVVPGIGTAIGAGIGALAGGALGFFGGSQTNASNAKQAQKNRDFQERMSSTAYQRAVEDMKKAGLNPALAYQQGGASSPSGSTAVMQDRLAGAANNARGAAQTYSEIQSAAVAREQQQANVELTKAQTHQLEIESAARAADIQAQADLSTTNARFAADTYTSRLEGQAAGVDLTRVQAQLTRLQQMTQQQINAFGAQTWALRVNQLKAQINQTLSSARESNAQALLNEYGQFGAKNKAKAEQGWFKKYVAPYLTDASTAAAAVTKAIK